MFTVEEMKATNSPYVIMNDSYGVGKVMCVTASHIMVKFSHGDRLDMVRHCDCYYNKGNPRATRKDLN